MEEISQFLKDYGELISITLIPVLLWIGSILYQNRDAKIRLQQELFLKLMANRGKNTLTPEWVDALNQIDVVFQKNSNVRKAWRDYYDSLHPASQHFGNNQAFLLDLLSEISTVLGYDNLKQTEIARFYGPRQFYDTNAAQGFFFQENLRVLLRSDSYGSKMKKEDYILHLEKLIKTATSDEISQFLMRLKTEAEKEASKKRMT